MHARLRQAHRRLSGGEYPGAGYQHRQPFSHDNWAKSVGISNYPLLSDIHRTVVKDYGVYWADWNANSRATFIVDKQGTIRFIERYGKGELLGARQDPRRGQEARLDVAGHVMADYILESRVWLARRARGVRVLHGILQSRPDHAGVLPSPRRRRTPRALHRRGRGSPSVVARRADALARVRARVGSALSLHRRPAPGPVPAGSIGIDSWRSGAGRGWTTG